MDEARVENDSNKEQRIEMELEKLNINRTIAVECWYTLHMKLDNYAPAKNLLKQLDHIHNDLSMDKDGERQEFQTAVDCLSRLTIDFCQLYCTLQLFCHLSSFSKLIYTRSELRLLNFLAVWPIVRGGPP
ncbi:hypothetical protein [Megasphaera elsdenii]|uniref:hypothetical protein n=1 Tax=Megasphaera elsdenii TaxID=907 RepID=UPI0039F56BFB